MLAPENFEVVRKNLLKLFGEQVKLDHNGLAQFGDVSVTMRPSDLYLPTKGDVNYESISVHNFTKKEIHVTSISGRHTLFHPERPHGTMSEQTRMMVANSIVVMVRGFISTTDTYSEIDYRERHFRNPRYYAKGVMQHAVGASLKQISPDGFTYTTVENESNRCSDFVFIIPDAKLNAAGDEGVFVSDLGLRFRNHKGSFVAAGIGSVSQWLDRKEKEMEFSSFNFSIAAYVSPNEFNRTIYTNINGLVTQIKTLPRAHDVEDHFVIETADANGKPVIHKGPLEDLFREEGFNGFHFYLTQKEALLNNNRDLAVSEREKAKREIDEINQSLSEKRKLFQQTEKNEEAEHAKRLKEMKAKLEEELEAEIERLKKEVKFHENSLKELKDLHAKEVEKAKREIRLNKAENTAGFFSKALDFLIDGVKFVGSSIGSLFFFI